MNVALVISILLHASVLALAVFGLPQLARQEPIENRLVVVDVVTVAEVTNAPPPAEAAKPDKTPPPPPEAAAKPAPTPPPPLPTAAAPAPAPPPPQAAAARPAPPPAPVPPPPTETAPRPEPAPPADAEPVPVPAERPEPPKPEPVTPTPVPVEKPAPQKSEPAPQIADAPKPEQAEPEKPESAEVERVEDQPPVPVPVSRPTPPERPKQVARQETPDTPEKKEPEKKDTFLNVLKTVQDLKRDAPAPQAEARPTPAPEADTTARRSSFDPNQRLSVSEMDAIRQQISGCWLVPAGAKNAANLAVEIDVTMNPDRTVRSAQVVDRGRMQNDPFFRSAAESALRALKSPNCSPLQLPPEKYDTWKNFTITFDPKDMLS